MKLMLTVEEIFAAPVIMGYYVPGILTVRLAGALRGYAPHQPAAMASLDPRRKTLTVVDHVLPVRPVVTDCRTRTNPTSTAGGSAQAAAKETHVMLT